MEESLSSKALQANLAETRLQEINIPPEHQRFIDITESHRGINQRTKEFLLEFHHPYSNHAFVVERWREIILRDFWFYNLLDNADEALDELLNLSRKLLTRDLSIPLKETIVQTLLEFIGTLTQDEIVRGEIIRKCLDILKEYLEDDELIVIRNARQVKTYLAETNNIDHISEQSFEFTINVLSRSIAFWESTSNIGPWFEDKQTLFRRDYQEATELLGSAYFTELRDQIDQSNTWDDLNKVPSFDDIANRFHRTVDKFDTALEKIYFIVYLLELPGMSHLKDNLLWDINRLLKNVHTELSEEQMISSSDNLIGLFDDLKSDHMSTVLDCLLTLGKELIDSKKPMVLDFFQSRLIRFGFISPGDIQLTQDWQVKANADHLKNIRVWLELIEHDPSATKRLLSALVANLRLGGVFITDTDLFQRDITNLLNSDIGPVYKQILDLTRLFPVYFSEIGAEGELRDVTTAIDEIGYRRDRLIHFLRKQTHTESNSTHVELTRRIIQFWYDGNISALADIVPADVIQSIDTNGEWFLSVHEIIQKLCEQKDCTPERLLDIDNKELQSHLSRISQYDAREKQRIEYILRIYGLLKEKYSFETGDIITILRKYRFFSEKELEDIATVLANDDKEEAIRQVYQFMRHLKQVILDPTPSEASETIYHKRHIAAGIPSMYGQYREPKLDALGLTFRLENVTSRIIEQLIEDINVDYITHTTLRRISSVLSLIQEGLEIDGIPHQGFNSNLTMLNSSFASASCSLNQYVNTFEFLEQNVKEIIDEYFLTPYDQPLRTIVPKLFEQEKFILDETQKKQLIHMKFEEFFRDILSSTFLIQTLDNLLSSTMTVLRNTTDHLPEDMIRDVMTYDPDLIICPLYEETPRMDNQIFLGAKAFFLKKLFVWGFHVPEGFVLTTEVFRHQEAIFRHPQIGREITRFIHDHMARLEKITGHQFGNPNNPLLLSVRGGTAISMPGAMSTLLNVGMNDDIAEGLSQKGSYGRTAWDCYRRFLQSWGMTHGIERDHFDVINAEFESRYDISSNIDFTAEQMREIVQEYKNVLKGHEIRIEDEPFAQLRQAIIDVINSWSSDRAKVFREHLQIADEWGTAVIVQKMVLGNIGKKSGTGVLFTHDPYEGKPGINIYGDYAQCGQGEDVVTGWLPTLPVTEYHRKKYQYFQDTSLESSFPKIYKKLLEITSQLVEDHQLGPQEIEFTFEGEDPKDLYILQTRRQDVKARDKRYVFRVPQERMEIVGRGIGIGGGALSGILAFNQDDLQHFTTIFPDHAQILVRPDTVPDDIGMIFNCDGLLTGKGGATSHAAVTAARLGKVCVVGCNGLLVNESERTCTFNGTLFRAGDKISIDGHLGNVYRGHYPTEIAEIT
ncbi:MAG: pyruvate phosphate dikinase [Chloroflexi bacterium]|nr:pyruvate phosphate dikinase [Chloroflexota bacterium]